MEALLWVRLTSAYWYFKDMLEILDFFMRQYRPANLLYVVTLVSWNMWEEKVKVQNLARTSLAFHMWTREAGGSYL